MKLNLKIGENVSEVITGNNDQNGHIRLSNGDRDYDIRYRPAGEHRYALVVDGKGLEAFVARTDEGKHIFINGKTFYVEDADRFPSRQRTGRGNDEGPGEVTSPMPAVVVRILVGEGDRVEKGQGLVVVSAMKMETTLYAPIDGEVTGIKPSVGEKVAPGEILVEIAEEQVSRME